MGYRSDVAFVIEFADEYSARDYFNSFDKEEAGCLHDCLECNGNFLKFFGDYLKWYEDYNDVSYVTSYYKESLNALGCYGYVFKRIGENYDDIEEDWGEVNGKYASTFALEINRSIGFNV